MITASAHRAKGWLGTRNIFTCFFIQVTRIVEKLLSGAVSTPSLFHIVKLTARILSKVTLDSTRDIARIDGEPRTMQASLTVILGEK